MPPINKLKAIQYSPDELRDLAGVSPSDIQLARDLWIRHAPPLYKGLMDAPLAGTPGSDRARYVWSPVRRLYLDGGTARPIPPLEIRSRAIDPFIQAISIRIREVSQRLQQNMITLAEWQREVMPLIKYSQIAAGLIANGGAGNNNENDYLAIAAFILALFLFFQSFTNEIESGKQLINGTLLSRGDLYANAARDAYEEMRRFIMQTYLGIEYERRVLDPRAHHCHTVILEDGEEWVGCPELAELGWQPVGVLPRLMATPCLSNCKCHFEFGVEIDGVITPMGNNVRVVPPI